jgi:hypothetical protein
MAIVLVPLKRFTLKGYLYFDQYESKVSTLGEAAKEKNSLEKWGKLKVVFIQSIQSKQAVQSHRQVF